MDNSAVEPRVVDAGRGAAWWGEGWRLFASNVWHVDRDHHRLLPDLDAASTSFPFVGSIAQALLTPVFMGGIVLGCRAIERDETLRVSHLFEGFQGAHFVPLMIIGVVNIGLFIVAVPGVGRRDAGQFRPWPAIPASDPMDPLAAPLPPCR